MEIRQTAPEFSSGEVGLAPIKSGHLPSEFSLKISTFTASEIVREPLKTKTLIQRHVSTLGSYNVMRAYFMQILLVTTTVREAFVAGDLSTAEKLLTQEIEAGTGNYISYANRSFVMARKLDWGCALQDAVKVTTTHYAPSK
jgi:hypothetical protein